jgi:hypothetical protein
MTVLCEQLRVVSHRRLDDQLLANVTPAALGTFEPAILDLLGMLGRP